MGGSKSGDPAAKERKQNQFMRLKKMYPDRYGSGNPLAILGMSNDLKYLNVSGAPILSKEEKQAARKRNSERQRKRIKSTYKKRQDVRDSAGVRGFQ